MRIWRYLAFKVTLACGVLAGMTSPAWAALEPHLTMPVLGTPDILLPSGAPERAVVLISDADGWNEPEKALAARLTADGVLVMGLDLPDILQRMRGAKDTCLDLIGQAEAISRQIQNHIETPTYVFPTLAGVGAGGALALGMAATTEDATVDRVVVVDPDAVVPSRSLLCNPAHTRRQGAGFTYDLPADDEPFPIMATLTGSGSDLGAKHLKAQQAHRRRLSVRTLEADMGVSPWEAMYTALSEPTPQGGHLLVGLPLVDLPALTSVPEHAKQVAIFYSGDGGWRDLDKDLAALLRREGLAVVGFDVLRYFWKPQTPEQTAQDLEKIITALRSERGYEQVVLIGFSFGADLLPIIYNRLSSEAQAAVVQMSLLGVSKAADFEVTVSGWLSRKLPDAVPVPPELAKINPRLIQCIYGEDDKTSVCQTLNGTAAQVIKTSGGHHFDGDYEGLARRVLDRLRSHKK